jgi:ATP-dependent phosphofructokinase / diphosphate-dependent phosphofructokinase
MPTPKKIGVLTGGGDAPGLNAVIRAVVKSAHNAGVEVLGLEDSFDGLIFPEKSRMLSPRDVTGILRLGGTILGTVNRGDPFAGPIVTPEGTFNYADRVVEMFKKLGLDALVCIGGDGTLAISHRFHKLGIPLVGVPKTIDNDIVGTNSCFGFDSAVSFATDAIDRLHTTAEAHRRIMIVEVMGRYAGWIALHAGVAGGADVILIPEIPYDVAKVAECINNRDKWGASSSSPRAPTRRPEACQWRRRRVREPPNGLAAPRPAWRKSSRRTPIKKPGTSSSATCSAAARRRRSIAAWRRGTAERPWNC